MQRPFLTSPPSAAICFLASVFFVITAALGSEPKCIVLGIADGTSQELVTAARIWSGGVKNRLALEDFSRSAIVKTYSASDLVTDSSAGASALARGIKCANRAVGQANANSTDAPPSLLDLAKAAGWSTAVVTDDSVTGGTPSPFLVEHSDREQHAEIAGKILPQLGKRADIVLGGGTQWFADLSDTPGLTAYKKGEKETVAKNASQLAGLPVRHFTSWESFAKEDLSKADQRPVLGTFAVDVCAFHADGVRTFRLLDMVKAAVAILEAKDRPFLLVFEAALPDKAAHLNNAGRALAEVMEFDATLDWLRKTLGPDALILATTDHNTGGFTLNGPPAPVRWKGDILLGENPATQTSILTWASGPGADRNSVQAKTVPSDPNFTQPALLPTKSAFHSGGDVWLLADGPGSERVHGYMDNTEIYNIVAGAISPSLGAHPSADSPSRPGAANVAQ